ncbi:MULTISPECIES: LamG domain-containing protein [unclassified Microcoleus]|uniref:LamG domain-containing protein n=1 Tax=unclassified Microcoleus TaxID=2642155 RepID=UPI002FD4EF47
MLLAKEKVQHINSIAHEGKVVVVATDTDSKIWYTVKQDGFEDSYLNQKPEERTGWEGWKLLELPNENDDGSVIEKEKEELTHKDNDSIYLLRSLYKTHEQSAPAPVQLVSGLGYLYIFRQSKTNTLLVDRFVLDGLTNTLTRKLEVRFKRSKQKHKPSQAQKKGGSGLKNIDSLDFTDINGNNFYEPTTELSLINNLSNGWFSVVLLPTNEQDKYRWHIFAYNSTSQKVELTTLRASEEGLFDVKDYTILDPEPRSIAGIIKRTLDLGTVTVAKGLTATKYDLQRERQTDEGMQLLRDSVRVMLAIGTGAGNVAAISFAVAADGTLSEIKETPDGTTIRRSTSRQILLPLNTLDQIKTIGTTNPPPQGTITGIARGEDDKVILTSNKATGLDETEITEVKITGNKDYNSLYSAVTRIDDNTFEITPEISNGGNWEVVPEEETGLIFNGIVTAYEITNQGQLKVTALNHGLGNGDSVQVVDTKDYNGTYTVTKIGDNTFSLDGVRWQAGTAISAKLRSEKRRGVIFDGVDDYIELPLSGKVLSSDFTVEAWIKPSEFGGYKTVLGTDSQANNKGLHLTVDNQGLRFGFYGNDTSSTKSLSVNTWYHVAFCYSKEQKEQTIVVNGVVDKVEKPHNPFQGTDKLKIGSSLGGNYFKGCIADVRIWDKACTAEEIKNSMYLQLTGQEAGLVGYWRLDAIVEEKKRQVIDFSVNGNDGIVKGGAYVSSVTLNRNLAGTQTQAIKYENEDLFAVSERATYTEEFEFKTNNNNLNPTTANPKFFALTYKGKKSQRSQDWITILAGTTQFTSLGNNWYKASSSFTVPDGISLVRSFGISDINGNWTTLEIRKHKIQLDSDSITEKKYTNRVNLTTLAETQAPLKLTLKAKLKALGDKELEQGIKLKRKRELDDLLAILGSKKELQNKIDAAEAEKTNLTGQVKKASEEYQTELANPVNYWLKIENTNRQGMVLGLDSSKWANIESSNNSQKQQWQLIPDGNLLYKLKNREYNDYLDVYKYASGWYYAGVGEGKTYSKKNFEKWKLVGNSLENSHVSGNDKFLATESGNTSVWLDQGKQNQWNLIKTQKLNDVIATKKTDWDTKKKALADAESELEKLRALQKYFESKKNRLQQELGDINGQIKKLSEQLKQLNTEFFQDKTSLQTPETPLKMGLLNKDSRGLETQGALLDFVRPASRLSAIETCEGNVQLSYFDDRGRMRQTNFDATADSKNPTIEQWIPDSVSACLNLEQNNSLVTLSKPIELGEEWTIEAWFFYPLPVPETSNWNSLIGGEVTDNPIIVKKEGDSDLLGTSINIYSQKNADFISSGYDLKNLSPGWYHLTAVAQEDTTLFYIDGEKVGDTKTKALEDAEDNLKKTPNDPTAKKRVEDIKNKKVNFKSTSNVKYIGNVQGGKEQFGKIAEVRFWDIALSAEEIAINSKTLITGNEPGLLAYYPLTEATGNKIQNKTGDGNNGTITGASWWGCAAPIGKLIEVEGEGNQVMQFDGVNDYVEIPYNSSLNPSQFTISCWAKLEREGNNSVINCAHSSCGYVLSITGDKNLNFTMYNNTTQYPISGFTLSGWVLNAWIHTCISYNGSTLKIYRNGNIIHTHDNVKYTANSTRPLLIAAAEKTDGKNYEFFNGKIAEVCIWNKARSEAEIKADMNQRLTGQEPGLVGYWPLDSIKLGKALDLTGNNNHGTVNGASLVTAKDFPIDAPPPPALVSNNALVSCEYSTVSKDRTAIMRRFFAAPTAKGVYLLPDKRIEELELKWIGNGQFAPTLLGYIEGAPPIPSENLTLDEGYHGATSVELALSEDVEFSWKRIQDSGLGSTIDTFIGANAEADAGFGFTTKISKIKSGFKGELKTSYQFQNDSSITSSSSLSMTDTIKLCGTQEQLAIFPHLGKRFIPKNVGYALVVSALSDVFITRLKRSGKMIGYQVLPVENMPPDINTITFLINPAYTMSGSLDGLTGSSATSQRFFKHVPEMRSQFGSLYPASYYRLQEAYDLKQQIDQQDKNREAYFYQFETLFVDQISLNKQIDEGNAPGDISVNRPEGKPEDNLTPEQQKDQAAAQQAQLQKETGAAYDQQSTAVKQKQSEIEQKIKDEEKRSQASASFAAWQRKMEDIQIRAGKRNIVNTYVWDADGGLRAEAQSFANTAEHSIGGAFNMVAGLGGKGNFGVFGLGAELTAQATVNLTQTMTKTEKRSKGIQLNVDLSGVEGRGVTDYNDYPVLAGEKVNRYRFMSFYLEGSTNNFNDFFSYVVDPEWLASNSEEARALREAKGKANKTWRVLHRVTYVERPALMGFGRDVRQLAVADSTDELSQLKAKVETLENQNAEMLVKLNAILNKLDSKP